MNALGLYTGLDMRNQSLEQARWEQPTSQLQN
ncbi:hypothetical protein V1289_004839 [Bradyrhizobium sp. AZCC 2289]